ncbi:MAG: hypothetical protein HUU15_06675 [Candidatus Brocadiae bacterium]|nr:hypothetical protein [Candidatus Brocadiia bacterium]
MHRCRPVLFLLLAAAAVGVAQTPGPAEELAARAEKLRGLVADLDSEDVSKREDAWGALLAAGGEAIPYLVDSIRRKGASQQLKVLQRLVEEENEPLPPELRMTAEDLKALIASRAEFRPDRDATRKYMYAKFLDAVDLYRKKHYQSALEHARAIQKLEPALDFNDTIVKLKKACEQGIIQATLVRSTVSVSHAICKDGQILKFTFELTNMSTDTVTIWLGDALLQNDPAVRSQVIDRNSQLEVEFREASCEPDGSSSEIVSAEPSLLKRYSIELKTAQTLRLAVVERLAEASDTHLKKLRARARLRFHSITGPGGGFPNPMELVFEETEARIFPGNLAEAQVDPFQGMLRALDAQDRLGVYLFANLVTEADRGMATEALMKALKHPQANEEDGRVLRNCLAVVTGQAFGKNEEWLRWHDAQSRK